MNLPKPFLEACDRQGRSPTEHCLFVNVVHQKLTHFSDLQTTILTISTAANGTGQMKGSFQTPLGLHRVFKKIGNGEPIGTVFKGRRPVRRDGNGNPTALITHRILWLQGLEPNLNRGGAVDSQERYIYIHGVGDESQLGQPHSKGCIHLSAKDLIPLFDAVPVDTLVYISEN